MTNSSSPNRQLHLTLVCLGIVGLAVILYVGRSVFIPFSVAFLLAYLLNPLVGRLQTLGVPRLLATALVLLAVLLILPLLGLVIFSLLRAQLESLVHHMPTYVATLKGWLDPLLQRFLPEYPERTATLLEKGIQRIGNLPLEFFSSLTSNLWGMVSRLFGLAFFLFNVVIIPVVTFYLLRDMDRLRRWCVGHLPVDSREVILERCREVDAVLGAFIRGQLLVVLILAGLYSIGLTLSGIPLSLLLGLLAGVASFIPYLGLLIALIPGTLLAFLQFRDWQHPLIVVAVVGAVQLLDGAFITPRVVGNRVGLHPVVIILAVLLGGKFFGFLGLLLAVPVAAVLAVFLKDGLRRYREAQHAVRP